MNNQDFKTNISPEQLHLKLWAKSNPYKSLLAHMVDSGCCAYQFLSASSSNAILSFLSQQWKCDTEAALSYCAYFTAMHDIGKAMPQFQRMDEGQFARLKDFGMGDLFSSIITESIRHEYFSARIMRRIWKARAVNRMLFEPYSCILSLHHQRIEGDLINKKIPVAWQNLQDQLESEIREVFNTAKELPHPDNMDATCTLLTGLVILCDWVSSSGPFDSDPEIDGEYLIRSKRIAEGTLKQYGLIDENGKQRICSFRAMWPGILSLRDIQTCCEKLDFESALTIIEAPMGEGKTEAALYLAERMRDKKNKRGIYVALPTQATSNQMYERTETMLESIDRSKARLMHGSAFLYENEARIQSADADEAERWLSSLRMAFLGENGVGTVDQAMASVLIARFSVLRLLGLTNKVLVIDEMHAYDAYMKEILKSLLSWCNALCIPVILLSATLQDSQRRDYLSCFIGNDLPELSDAYPLITQIDHTGSLIQIPTQAALQTDYYFEPVRLGNDPVAIARFAVEKVAHGGCYCVLVNTVRKAQDIYCALLEMVDTETETSLFPCPFYDAEKAKDRRRMPCEIWQVRGCNTT